MTGGKALPADMTPQSAPGAANQADSTGEPGPIGQPDVAGQSGATAQTGTGGGAGNPGGSGGHSGADSSGNPSDSSESDDTRRAGALGGLPRPFFADQPTDAPQSFGPGQTGAPGPPYGQPATGGPRYGWPGQTPGQAPGQNGLGQRGNQPGSWPPRPTPQRRLPQRQAPQGAASHRPLRAPERELRQRAIASLVFGAVALIALLGLGTDLRKGVYLLIFSAVVGLAGCIIGITAVMKARKTNTFRPRGAVGGIVLGALATLISVPILAVYLAFPTQVDNYVNCLRQAQTSSDQSSCMSKFYRSINLGGAAAPRSIPGRLTWHAPTAAAARASHGGPAREASE